MTPFWHAQAETESWRFESDFSQWWASDWTTPFCHAQTAPECWRFESGEPEKEASWQSSEGVGLLLPKASNEFMAFIDSVLLCARHELPKHSIMRPLIANLDRNNFITDFHEELRWCFHVIGHEQEKCPSPGELFAALYMFIGRRVRESEHYFSSGQDGIYRKEKELRIVVLNIQHEVFPSD